MDLLGHLCLIDLMAEASVVCVYCGREEMPVAVEKKGRIPASVAPTAGMEESSVVIFEVLGDWISNFVFVCLSWC